MSRCFPFPPPGYSRNGQQGAALIESIKLQREIEKAKKARKKEKKEKKEKRRKEKEERKQREGAITTLTSESKKFKHIDQPKEINAAYGKLQKGEDFENGQLERSGITEEHEQPVTSREPCCLSDSTQTSGKRKRSSSPTSSQDHGTAFKLRLPLRKHSEPEESKSENHVGSSSGSVKVADPLTKYPRGSYGQLQQHQERVTNAECVRIADPLSKESRGSNHLSKQQEHVKSAKTNQILGKSDSNHCKAVQNLDHGDVLVAKTKPGDKLAKVASLYHSLFQNPLACEVSNSENDQDWLFSSQPVTKKVKPETVTQIDSFRCSTSSLWPRSQFIPEVDIYALPYTVPF